MNDMSKTQTIKTLDTLPLVKGDDVAEVARHAILDAADVAGVCAVLDTYAAQVSNDTVNARVHDVAQAQAALDATLRLRDTLVLVSHAAGVKDGDIAEHLGLSRPRVAQIRVEASFMAAAAAGGLDDFTRADATALRKDTNVDNGAAVESLSKGRQPRKSRDDNGGGERTVRTPMGRIAETVGDLHVKYFVPESGKTLPAWSNVKDAETHAAAVANVRALLTALESITWTEDQDDDTE
jgi:hypothetical protein